MEMWKARTERDLPTFPQPSSGFTRTTTTALTYPARKTVLTTGSTLPHAPGVQPSGAGSRSRPDRSHISGTRSLLSSACSWASTRSPRTT